MYEWCGDRNVCWRQLSYAISRGMAQRHVSEVSLHHIAHWLAGVFILRREKTSITLEVWRLAFTIRDRQYYCRHQTSLMDSLLVHSFSTCVKHTHPILSRALTTITLFPISVRKILVTVVQLGVSHSLSRRGRNLDYVEDRSVCEGS